MLTRSSRWVDGVEKKKRDTRVVLSDSAAAVDVCHCKAGRPGSFPLQLNHREGVPCGYQDDQDAPK